MKLYKYIKAEYLGDILKNESFKLNHAEDFNDPFDSVINISNKRFGEVEKLIDEYIIFRKLSELFKT